MECGVQSLLDTAYFNIVKFLKGNLYFEYTGTIYIEYTFFYCNPCKFNYLVSLQRFNIIHVKQTKEGRTALSI